MNIVILYIATVVAFLGLDVIGLRFIVRPVFDAHVPHLLLDSFKLGPAAVFYLFYVAALIWLVSLPLLEGGSTGRLILNAAIFGAAAYGTFEFTSYAVLKDWHWQMVATDTTWGAVLTATSATIGVLVTRVVS